MRGYVLLLMSVARCLTVTRPTRPMTQRAVVISVVIGMIVICLLNSPFLVKYHVIEISSLYADDTRHICVGPDGGYVSRSSVTFCHVCFPVFYDRFGMLLILIPCVYYHRQTATKDK